MEVEEGPPPFNEVANEENSSTFNKMNSIDEDEDDEEEIDKPNLTIPNDLATANSFSNESDDVHTARFTEIQENDSFDKENDEDDDEWGDFGEAQPVVSTENVEDDWGDFDQARPSVESNETSEQAKQLAHQKSLEDWGAFENAAEKSENGDEEDEWQAEFSSAAVPAQAEAEKPAEIANLKFLDEMLEDLEFWEQFKEEDEEEKNGFDENLNINDIPEIFDSENLSNEFIGQDFERRKFAQLWLSLRVVEEAVSLKFEWKSSQTRIKHFESLKIDPNRVQKTGKAIFDTSSILLPTPLQSSSTSSSSTTATTATTTSSSLAEVTSGTTESVSTASTSTESPSIPVVDFDWDTSGLTNPLKGASQSSAIIDVDFLSMNGGANSFTNPLQKDLAEFGLNKEVEKNGNTSGSILDSIMSKANDGRKSPYKDSKVLSLDAKNLLDQLPDLEYLQSNMLMFPMGHMPQ